MKCCIWKETSHKAVDCPLSWYRRPTSSQDNAEDEECAPPPPMGTEGVQLPENSGLNSEDPPDPSGEDPAERINDLPDPPESNKEVPPAGDLLATRSEESEVTAADDEGENNVQPPSPEMWDTQLTSNAATQEECILTSQGYFVEPQPNGPLQPRPEVFPSDSSPSDMESPCTAQISSGPVPEAFSDAPMTEKRNDAQVDQPFEASSDPKIRQPYLAHSIAQQNRTDERRRKYRF